MLENSFVCNLHQHTINHLEKWNHITRKWDEPIMGYGGISHAYVTERLDIANLAMDRFGKEYTIFKFTRSVMNEWGRAYPPLEEESLAVINNCGELCLCNDITDVMRSIDLWAKWSHKETKVDYKDWGIRSDGTICILDFPDISAMKK